MSLESQPQEVGPLSADDVDMDDTQPPKASYKSFKCAIFSLGTAHNANAKQEEVLQN